MGSKAMHRRAPSGPPYATHPPSLVHQVKNSTSSFRTFALIGVAAACYAEERQEESTAPRVCRP